MSERCSRGTRSASVHSYLLQSARLLQARCHGKDEKESFGHPRGEAFVRQRSIGTCNTREGTFGRAALQPGWKWSTCVKPIVNTQSCEASHLQYHVSGRLGVPMDDGSEDEFGPGEVSLLPPGHDAWVWATSRSWLSISQAWRNTQSGPEAQSVGN